MKGVYEIRNTVTGECYIGKADSFEARWKLHRDTLRERRHHNHLLQAAWNSYGEDAFEFTVLEEIRDSTGVTVLRTKSPGEQPGTRRPADYTNFDALV